MQRKLVVGNWKMHGSRPANAELLAALLAARPFGADVAVCVPFVYLNETAATLAGSDLRWGAQDVSAHEQGAYTGEVSAAMLAECGCRYVIVGHSERRAMHAESDQLVADKAKIALAHRLVDVGVDTGNQPLASVFQMTDGGQHHQPYRGDLAGRLDAANHLHRLHGARDELHRLPHGWTPSHFPAVCSILVGLRRCGACWIYCCLASELLAVKARNQATSPLISCNVGAFNTGAQNSSLH